MSDLPQPRVPRTACSGLLSCSAAISGLSSAACETKGHRGLERAPEGAEHRPVMHRLRRRDRGVGVAHRGGGDHAALEDQRRLDAEESRLPEHQVGELADLDRADQVADAVRDRRVDRCTWRGSA
jgi:hypothetical protein